MAEGGGRGRFRRRVPEPGSGATAPGLRRSPPAPRQRLVRDPARGFPCRLFQNDARLAPLFRTVSGTVFPASSLLSHYTLVSAVIRGFRFVSSGTISPYVPSCLLDIVVQLW